MRILIAIMFGIGFFALAGLAINIFFGVLLALYEIPRSIIMKYRRRDAEIRSKERIKSFVTAITQSIENNKEKSNCNKAYNDGVKKVSKSKKSK